MAALININEEHFNRFYTKRWTFLYQGKEEQMANALSRGHRIEIRGFGSFSLHFREPRTGRNPKTGDSVSLTGKFVPHFKPGKELREIVNDSLVKGIPLKSAADGDDGRDDFPHARLFLSARRVAHARVAAACAGLCTRRGTGCDRGGASLGESPLRCSARSATDRKSVV